MKRFSFFVTIIIVFYYINTTSAMTTVHTDESTFLSAIQPGYYLEEFDAFTGGFEGYSLDFGPVNGFSYTISSPGGLYSLVGAIASWNSFDPLNITFTGSAVTAVGGIFWPTDFLGQNIVGNIDLWLSDGTSHTVIDADLNTFRGFVSDGAAFTSMAISTPTQGEYPSVDHIYVGQTIPAPGAILLSGIGAGLVGIMRRRKTI